MTPGFHISRRTAAEWVEHLHSVNSAFIRDLSFQDGIEVANFVGRFTLHMLSTLSDLGKDDAERSHISEYAAHGMSHAVVQHLLFTSPPELHPPEGTIKQ